MGDTMGRKRKREKTKLFDGEQAVASAMASKEAEEAAAEAKKAKAAAEAERAAEAKQRKRVLALEYLQTWSTVRSAWRFNKKLQQWWVEHWGSTVDVSKADFATFVDYAESISGAVRGRLLADAKVAAAVEAVEDTEDPAVKAVQKKRIRAKKLVKALEAAPEPKR